MPEYRVIAYSREEPHGYGYAGTETVHYQELQESYTSLILRRKRWRTIDIEEVPAHVKISMGAFGDTGGWRSKFSDYLAWGRDGACTLRV